MDLAVCYDDLSLRSLPLCPLRPLRLIKKFDRVFAEGVGLLLDGIMGSIGIQGICMFPSPISRS
ncbi:hypothetical protein QT971_16285 [Microcoleus sp. herbarium19]|uniref:hypothetical protein n=1 Tax=unclassified Microcoleus TaxID=2642155 RepID=UPI002FD1F800